MLRVLALAAGILLVAPDAEARQTAARDSVGDTYEVRMRLTTESATEDGSSRSSSRSGGLLIERVVAIGDEGIELEFDLPEDATPEERQQEWQWPVRVLKAPDGALELLNGPELEQRIAAWLAAAELPRAACGHWFFTWNAFKIECDPRSVLETLAIFDLRSGDIRDGTPYTERRGLGAAPLRMESEEGGISTFVAELPIDPDVVRRELAEADVALGEIMGEPTTLETALRTRAQDPVSATISATLQTDAEGRVVRRTTVAVLTTTNPDGVPERRTSTQTVERRRTRPEPPEI